MARWPGGGQVEDHDHDQDQVQEQGAFCSGKAIIEWWVGIHHKKIKKNVYIFFLNRFLEVFLGIS